MATPTYISAAEVGTSSNAETYTTPSFTPPASRTLYVFVGLSNTAATVALNDTQTLGWTQIELEVNRSGSDQFACFVSNTQPANSAMTITATCTGDQAAGCVIRVYEVDITRTGSAAVRQSFGAGNQTAGTTPTATFGAATLTTNPIVGMIYNVSNPGGITSPGGTFNERNDGGYNTPTTGWEVVDSPSGHASTTVTWGSTSATQFAVIAVEVDASALGGASVPKFVHHYRQQGIM